MVRANGRHGDAIRCYDEALEDSSDADVLTSKGDAFAEIGENKKAVECHDKVFRIGQECNGYRFISMSPDSNIEYDGADVLSRKISVLYDLGEYDEALRCYDSIIDGQRSMSRTTYHPESGMVAFAKVLFLDEIGRHEEAVRWYEKYGLGP